MNTERHKRSNMAGRPFTFFEFFAGGGMARLGLGDKWKCVFANDWCEKKAAAYRACFGGSGLRVCSVADLTPGDLPGTPDLVWGPPSVSACGALSVARRPFA
jgi:site-specific DNA-cytosine methylase